MRTGWSPISSSAITAPRGSKVGRSSAAQSITPTCRFTRIALPCQPMLRVFTFRKLFGVLARILERAAVANSEMDRLVHAVRIDQLMRHRRSAPAEALVGFLKRDHVGVDLMQDVENPLRIAPPVEPDRLAHIIACDGEGGRWSLQRQ